MAHTSNLVSHYVSEAVGNIKDKLTFEEVKNLDGLPTNSVAKFKNNKLITAEELCIPLTVI